VDKDLLKEYFAPVSELSLKLEKQLKFVLRRTLNTVRKDPKVIVSALRVIEREEKTDAECQSRFKSTGFLPPNRPKSWRHKAMEVLKINVMERIEGNQPRLGSCALQFSAVTTGSLTPQILGRRRNGILERLRF
jgi:exocyst complex component 3